MIELAVDIVFAMICVALGLAFYRLAQGPRLPSRVVALELITSLIIGAVAVYAIKSDIEEFLDVAIVTGLLGFMATVGFARYIEKGGPRDD